MDKPKTKLVKSKSSNSAITTKSEPRKGNSNKKSRSNAEFQPLILKKRGVYVEKKPTKISINEEDISPVALRQPSSPRPIPRPGRKRFLASVLTILSQSTTGTQYPDKNDINKLRKQDKTKSKLRKKREDESIQEHSTSTQITSKKRQKYRSKILNNNDSELEQLVVLQSTKEITHTPSNYSDNSNNIYKDAISTHKEPETIKWADILTPLAKNTTADNVPEPLEKDGREKQEKRVTIVDKDPSTLIAEVPKKDEKKLYNFFRDLLETTFSVYNVKTEFNQQPTSSVNSSKVALEIDESVAKKLNIQKPNESPEDVTRNPSSKYFYFIKPDPNEAWDDKQLLDHFQPKFMSSKRSRAPSPTKSQKRKRRLQSESFEHKKSKLIPLTTSLTIPTKRIQLKKDRKKHFINLLKEQLKMEDDAFEEPQNFFQALKVIARNKRRCQKSIHIQEAKRPSEGDVHVCQFRRRRLLSASTKSSGRKSGYHPESDVIRSMRSFSRKSDTTYNSSRKRNTITISETSEVEPYSEHSLEVFGFDYETNTNKKIPNFDKESSSFHMSDGTSIKDLNVDDTLLKYCDSGNSYGQAGQSHVANKHGLRSLNKLLE